MSLTVNTKDFDNLFEKFDQLGKVGQSEVGKQSVKEGLNVFVEALQLEAPKDQDNKGMHQAEFLDIRSIKTYSKGAVWGACGIHKKNWDKTKGLYFQHYGYTTSKGDKITVHAGWMTRAFEKSKSKAESKMKQTLESEIERLL